MSEVTKILNELESSNDPDIVNKLMPAVYDELRQMAQAKLAREKVGQTLNTTGLVHEAYLRLSNNPSFTTRRHFFGAAAEAMRRILIDKARSKKSTKRGGQFERIDVGVDELMNVANSGDQRLQSLSESLERFESKEPQKAELVKLRYFIGLSIKEAAEILGISTATADRHWAYSKAWLQSDMLG